MNKPYFYFLPYANQRGSIVIVQFSRDKTNGLIFIKFGMMM